MGSSCKVIPTSKATLSNWCQEIQLTPDQLSSVHEAGRQQAGQKLHRRNLDRIAKILTAAQMEAKSLASDPYWVAGVVAYWAEGSKRENKLGFSNSDPQMIRLFIVWAKTYLDASSDRFTITLHLHSGQSEAERKQYWSAQTNLKMSQFRKSFIKPEGTGHRKNVLYNRTATIRVRRSGPLLHRVMGWIDYLMSAESGFCTIDEGR